MDKPQICYVAFLDIMGFAALVEQYTPEYVLKYLCNLLTVNSVYESITPNIKTSIISDTIAVYNPVLNNEEDLASYLGFLRFAGALQFHSITAPNFGLPLRGAITKGEFYSNNKDILFGKAWVEAYRLENSKAIFPRVIVSKDANKYNCLLTMHISDQINNRVTPLRMDIDDEELFCNYLNNILDDKGNLPPKKIYDESISSHRDRIVQALTNTDSDTRILEKYKWLQSYHNWFCSGYDELKNYVISKIG